MNPTSSTESFPKGLGNAFWFAGFNAVSFQMVLSSPIILYAKSLGASATVLGIIAGMMPLLVIFQIPAASHIPRYGYKRFVYGGWGIRVMFIFAMAFVPIAGAFLQPPTQLALLLFLLFGFNLSRGISSCAWLPWITSLVPASVRGAYLARDAACVNIGSFIALTLAAGMLWTDPQAWQFSVLFVISAAMGMTSLVFLKRIPETEAIEQTRVSTEPVPWKAIAGYEPFRKLLRANVAWAISYGGMAAFTVAFLKTEVGFSECHIILLTSATFVGGLASLTILGSRLDRLGSKPVMTFSVMLWIGLICGWTLLAGGVLKPIPAIVLLLQLLMGLGASLVNMANTRLAMAIIPPMGRNHFFALFSVVQNLTLGIAPIAWGLLIDSARRLKTDWHGFEWNRYSLFFALAAIAFLVTLSFCRKLHEPQAVRMDELFRELFIASPQRVWVRFWPRA